jgi:hypothetical protein
MSTIKNEAHKHFPLFVAIRELMEHRALWLYLLIDEAEKAGIDLGQVAPKAIHRCGIYQGGLLRTKAGTQSLKGLKKALFSWSAQQIFEMTIVESTDDKLSIDFHYCPLVKAWQKQGCTDEQCAKLCDYAMCGDRGIGESFGAALELPRAISRGDETCQIRFVRK